MSSDRKYGTVGVDVDDTIWNLIPDTNRALQQILNTKEDIGVWPRYDYIRSLHGDEIAERAFKIATDPKVMMERELMPGCADALNEIAEDFNVHFITHSWRGQRMRPALERWLDDRLDFDFGLTIVKTYNKVRVLKRLKAFAMIDDKPATLKAVADAGMWACSYYLPWLDEVIAEDERINFFYHWDSAPAMVRRAKWGNDPRTTPIVLKHGSDRIPMV